MHARLGAASGGSADRGGRTAAGRGARLAGLWPGPIAARDLITPAIQAPRMDVETGAEKEDDGDGRVE